MASLAPPAGFAVTILGTSTPFGMGLGYSGVFAAIIADFYVKAAVNTGRFRPGKWREVTRASGVGAGASDD